MTQKDADRRALAFVRRYPPKKIHALPKETLMRDAFAKGLLAAQRRTAVKEPVRLKIQ